MFIDSENVVALTVDIIGAVATAAHTIRDLIALGGTVPGWFDRLVGVLDGIASIVNAVKGLVFLSFALAPAQTPIKLATKELTTSGVLGIIGSVGSFGLASQDVVNQREDNIENSWTPQQIIQNCQQLNYHCS